MFSIIAATKLQIIFIDIFILIGIFVHILNKPQTIKL